MSTCARGRRGGVHLLVGRARLTAAASRRCQSARRSEPRAPWRIPPEQAARYNDAMSPTYMPRGRSARGQAGDLFRSAAARDSRSVPLAERMRPRSLDEVVGQRHILGPNTLLREAIETDRVPSLILWGPPGTGKTTLARVIAAVTQAELIALSAVEAGIKDIRETVQHAELLLGEQHRRTLLFIDEIHRFNKAQQDALLPHVEKGTVSHIAATTENPSCGANSALLSRCRVFALRPLEEHDLRELVLRALRDADRGLGRTGLRASDAFLDHVVRH